MVRTSGLTSRRFVKNAPRSKSRYGSRSTLLMITTSADRNITGYLSGFSSPSVTEKTIARACSPTSNSAGHTRLPTFSMTTTSRAAPGRAAELAGVPDDDGFGVGRRQAGERRPHHGRVEVALTAEAVRGVDKR